MSALSPHTELLFGRLTTLGCIRPYILVGGTALALQINARLSQDLDFMRWTGGKAGKPEVDWPAIEKELGRIGSVESREIWDSDHVEFTVDKVKVSFYASSKRSPVISPVHYANNLYLADLTAIAALKMELLMRRSNFRDYYDIYSLLRHGIDLKVAVGAATEYSGHLLSTKNLLAMLADHQRFKTDWHFQLLKPVYSITPEEIEQFLKAQIKASFRTKME